MQRRQSDLLGAFVVFAALVCTPSVALAQVAPPAGTALDQFSFFGHSAATGSAVAGSQVDGDVGSFPTDTVSNFPPTSVTAGFFVRRVALGDGPLLIQARTDATAAFVALNQVAGATLAAELGGTAPAPGVYDFLGGAALLSGGLTLTLNDPNGIWVFRTASTLTTINTSNVVGTANPCNVYWQIGSSATIDSDNFFGQVFANASVDVTGNLIGKAVAGANGATGAVTMTGLTSIGGCASAGFPPPGPAPVPALPDAAAWGLLAILLASGALVLGRR